MRPLSVVLLLVTTALTTGCDGYINVRGQVVEWDNAPAGAESQILITEAVPDSVATTPLPGALSLVYSGLSRGEAGYLADSVLTGPDGAFDVGFVTSPFQHPVTVRVSRQSYRPVEIGLVYGRPAGPTQGNEFHVSVLLVRE